MASFPVDIWAIGTITLALLTGTRFFHPVLQDGEIGHRKVLEMQLDTLGGISQWPGLASLPRYQEMHQAIGAKMTPQADDDVDSFAFL